MPNQASDYLDDIQLVFLIVYVVIYAAGLVGTFFYAIYVESAPVSSSSSEKNSKSGQSKSKTGQIVTAITTTLTLNDPQDFGSGAEIENVNSNKGCCKSRKSCFICVRQVIKRVRRYKSVYLTAIIHFSDVITDYLVLAQYIVFAIDELTISKFNHPNINYLFVALASALTIILNKILSSYIIWKFTQDIWDVILNVCDFYIFKEIIASHKCGNKTDLMQFLQKVEKIFER